MGRTSDPSLARQISMDMVMDTVLKSGTISRTRLADVTGLSKQTISDVVRELEDNGWLRERGRTPGNVGRTAITYEIDTSAAYLVSVDLGGTKVHIAVADVLGNIIAEEKQPTDERGGTFIIEQIVGTAQRLACGVAIDPDDLRLLVLGMPGVLYAETGALAAAPNIPGFATINVQHLLSERFGGTVIIENDVNLAAMGEQWRGHGAELTDFAFIALGTGIGMGIVANGRLLKGSTGAAGEISYMPIGGALTIRAAFCSVRSNTMPAVSRWCGVTKGLADGLARRCAISSQHLREVTRRQW